MLWALIALVAAAAGTALALGLSSAMETVRARPYDFALLVTVCLALQLVSLNLGGKGSMGVSAIGIVAAAVIIGTASAMAIGTVLALAQWARRRGLAHKAIFDAGNFTLAAAIAGVLYDTIVPAQPTAAAVFAGATVAGAAYSVVNIGLLCIAMSLSESRAPWVIWKERFAWAWFALLAFGPLAGVAAINFEQSRLGGVLSFLLLPLLLVLGMSGQLDEAGLGANVVPRAGSVRR